MEKIKQYLEKNGIKGVKEIVHNPTYEQLFQDEMSPENQGFERGVLTKSGAVAVKTGVFTGQPKPSTSTPSPQNQSEIGVRSVRKSTGIGCAKMNIILLSTKRGCSWVRHTCKTKITFKPLLFFSKRHAYSTTILMWFPKLKSG